MELLLIKTSFFPIFKRIRAVLVRFMQLICRGNFIIYFSEPISKNDKKWQNSGFTGEMVTYSNQCYSY